MIFPIYSFLKRNIIFPKYSFPNNSGRSGGSTYKPWFSSPQHARAPCRATRGAPQQRSYPGACAPAFVCGRAVGPPIPQGSRPTAVTLSSSFTRSIRPCGTGATRRSSKPRPRARGCRRLTLAMAISGDYGDVRPEYFRPPRSDAASQEFGVPLHEIHPASEMNDHNLLRKMLEDVEPGWEGHVLAGNCEYAEGEGDPDKINAANRLFALWER